MEKINKDMPGFTDDSIRRFLLGELPASEQTILEERLFTDGELEERVRLAEFELADDYAFKRLSASETKSFRERYVLTTSRRQQLNASQALSERFAPQPVFEARPGIKARLAAAFDIRRPAWRYGFVAFILVLFLAAILLVTKEPEIVNTFIPKRFKPRPSPTATPQQTHHPPSSSSPVHVEESPLEPPHEMPPVVSLNATNTADQSPSMTLPTDENGRVRFQLSLDSVEGIYRADVLQASGETVFSAEALRPFGTKPSIVCDVPANALHSGQYQIRLTRVDDQSKQQVLQYYFRVQ